MFKQDNLVELFSSFARQILYKFSTFLEDSGVFKSARIHDIGVGGRKSRKNMRYESLRNVWRLISFELWKIYVMAEICILQKAIEIPPLYSDIGVEASGEYREIRAISKFQLRNVGDINAQISSELERRFLAILKVARSSFRIA